VWQRAVAVFTRPASAFIGLETRAQWWFPLLLMMLVGGTISTVLHERALVPMIVEQWESQVESGQLPADRLDRMEEFMRSPAGLIVTTVQQVIIWPILMAVMALLVWFGVGFVLGTKFRYRHAFEVVCWSSLVLIPAQILTAVLAWSRETLRGIHVGFGLLLPESDTPSKLQIGLGILLDALGPLSLWAVLVAILGAAYLSKAKRSSVAWVMGVLYLAVSIFFAALAAMFAPAT
jgi:hypothetical protein